MPDKITEAVHATPYPSAPSIWIAYPEPGDWKRLFLPVLDPHLAADVHWLRAKYNFMRSNHEANVKGLLDAIASQHTGQTLFQLFRERPGHSVMIFPYIFAPRYLEGSDADTRPVEPYAATAKNKPMVGASGKNFCTFKFDGARICRGTGTGSAVDIFFLQADPLGFFRRTNSTDDMLLHELVHALRMVSGVDSPLGVSGGYENQEEFLAVLVTNMYRSHRNKPLFDYLDNPIEAGKFLDTNIRPSPRELIWSLANGHPRLFDALKSVRAPFNPIKQFFDEL